MPSKKKAPIKVCPAKIVYIIEYNDGWMDDEYWIRAVDLPVITTLRKDGKLRVGTRWVEDDRPFRRKEDAQFLVDAMNKSINGDEYRVSELICR